MAQPEGNTHSAPKLIFPFAPKPYLDESIASWLMRLCGSHQYPFYYVENLLGFRPKRRDWDCGLTLEQTDKLLQAAGLTRRSFFYGKLDPWLLQESGLNLQPWVADAKPRYLWCARCLATDKEPYLRWQWRYQYFFQCSVHGDRLRERCPECSGLLLAHRSLMLQGNAGPLLMDLSSCQKCGEFLARPLSHETDLDEVKKKQAEAMFGSVQILRLGWISIRPWGIKVRPPEAPAFSSLRSTTAPRQVGSKWSRNLTAQARSRLAASLWMVRKELHTYRREARAKTQVQSQTEAQGTRP